MISRTPCFCETPYTSEENGYFVPAEENMTEGWEQDANDVPNAVASSSAVTLDDQMETEMTVEENEFYYYDWELKNWVCKFPDEETL